MALKFHPKIELNILSVTEVQNLQTIQGDEGTGTRCEEYRDSGC